MSEYLTGIRGFGMDLVNDKTVIALASCASFQSMGDSAVILRTDNGQLFTCNETTEALLRRVDGQRNLSEIIDIVLPEYEVDRETLRADFLAIVDNLVAEGIVVIA
jgi:hypothetical protein